MTHETKTIERRPEMRTTLVIGLIAIALLILGTILANSWQRVSLRQASDTHAALNEIERDLVKCRSLGETIFLRYRPDHVREHERLFGELLTETEQLRQRVTEPAMRRMLDELQRDLSTYDTLFLELVENVRRRLPDGGRNDSRETDTVPSLTFEMRRLGRSLEDVIQDAGNVSALEAFLQVRRYEKNFLLYGDVILFDDPVSCVEMWDTYLASARESLGSDALALELLDAYQERSGELRSNVREGAEIATRLEAAAARCHHLSGELQTAAVEHIGAAARLSRRVSLASLATVGVLFLGIAWWLIRAVIEPIEHLKELAQTTRGDIQDLHVEFEDLDTRRFRSRESLDLALALQRMVGRMRQLVASERGLMERHHMAIVLAVDTMLGAVGRPLVERARAAAGLDSLSQLRADELDRFLDELDTEIGDLLGVEDKRELAALIKQELARG